MLNHTAEDILISIRYRGFQEATGAVDKLIQTLNRGTDPLKQFQLGSDLAAKSLAALGLSAAGAGIGITRLGSDLQKAMVSFRVFTGGADAAQKFVRSLQQFSSGTPFIYTQWERGARSLLAYGTQVQNVTHLLKQVGNIASATGANLEFVADAFSQIQVGNVGVGLATLRAYGVPTTAIQASLMSQGFRGSPYEAPPGLALKAVGQYTDTKFQGLMDQLMNTLPGAMSNLKENVEIFGRELGLANANDLVPLIRSLAGLVKTMNTLDSATKGAVGKLLLVGGIGTAITGLVTAIRAAALSYQADMAIVEMSEAAKEREATASNQVTAAKQREAAASSNSSEVRAASGGLARSSWAAVGSTALSSGLALGGAWYGAGIGSSMVGGRTARALGEKKGELLGAELSGNTSAVATLTKQIDTLNSTLEQQKMTGGLLGAAAGTAGGLALAEVLKGAAKAGLGPEVALATAAVAVPLAFNRRIDQINQAGIAQADTSDSFSMGQKMGLAEVLRNAANGTLATSVGERAINEVTLANLKAQGASESDINAVRGGKLPRWTRGRGRVRVAYDKLDERQMALQDALTAQQWLRNPENAGQITENALMGAVRGALSKAWLEDVGNKTGGQALQGRQSFLAEHDKLMARMAKETGLSPALIGQILDPTLTSGFGTSLKTAEMERSILRNILPAEMQTLIEAGRESLPANIGFGVGGALKYGKSRGPNGEFGQMNAATLTESIRANQQLLGIYQDQYDLLLEQYNEGGAPMLQVREQLDDTESKIVETLKQQRELYAQQYQLQQQMTTSEVMGMRLQAGPQFAKSGGAGWLTFGGYAQRTSEIEKVNLAEAERFKAMADAAQRMSSLYGPEDPRRYQYEQAASEYRLRAAQEEYDAKRKLYALEQERLDTMDRQNVSVAAQLTETQRLYQTYLAAYNANPDDQTTAEATENMWERMRGLVERQQYVLGPAFRGVNVQRQLLQGPYGTARGSAASLQAQLEQKQYEVGVKQFEIAEKLSTRRLAPDNEEKLRLEQEYNQLLSDQLDLEVSLFQVEQDRQRALLRTGEAQLGIGMAGFGLAQVRALGLGSYRHEYGAAMTGIAGTRYQAGGRISLLQQEQRLIERDYEVAVMRKDVVAAEQARASWLDKEAQIVEQQTALAKTRKEEFDANVQLQQGSIGMLGLERDVIEARSQALTGGFAGWAGRLQALPVIQRMMTQQFGLAGWIRSQGGPEEQAKQAEIQGWRSATELRRLRNPLAELVGQVFGGPSSGAAEFLQPLVARIGSARLLGNDEGRRVVMEMRLVGGETMFNTEDERAMVMGQLIVDALTSAPTITRSSG